MAKQITHRYTPFGTRTGRGSHQNINMSQVPKDKEFRELFTVPDKGNYSIIGSDLKSIELRVLAHYLYQYDNGEYLKVVTEQDPHEYNAGKFGLSRDGAKTAVYGLLYGKGNTAIGFDLINYKHEELEDIVATEDMLAKAKQTCVGRVVNKDGSEVVASEVDYSGKYMYPVTKDSYMPFTEDIVKYYLLGKKVSENFFEGIKGLDELIDALRLEIKSNKGYIKIQGQHIYNGDEPHKLLNTLLQGTAAVIAKQWIISIYDELEMLEGTIGIDYWLWLHSHDEVQLVCQNGYVDDVVNIVNNSCSEIQTELGLDISITCDTKTGLNWSETH